MLVFCHELLSSIVLKRIFRPNLCEQENEHSMEKEILGLYISKRKITRIKLIEWNEIKHHTFYRPGTEKTDVL